MYPLPLHHYQQQQHKSSYYLLSPDHWLDSVWHIPFNCYKIPIIQLPSIEQSIKGADLGFETDLLDPKVPLPVFHLILNYNRK